jgi:hypothetical protein
VERLSISDPKGFGEFDGALTESGNSIERGEAQKEACHRPAALQSLHVTPRRPTTPRVRVDFRLNKKRDPLIEDLEMKVAVDIDEESTAACYAFELRSNRGEPRRVDVTQLFNNLKRHGGLVDPFDEAGVQRQVLQTVTGKLAAFLESKRYGVEMEITMPTCFSFGVYGFDTTKAKTLPNSQGRLPMRRHVAQAGEVVRFIDEWETMGTSAAGSRQLNRS